MQMHLQLLQPLPPQKDIAYGVIMWCSGCKACRIWSSTIDLLCLLALTERMMCVLLKCDLMQYSLVACFLQSVLSTAAAVQGSSMYAMHCVDVRASWHQQNVCTAVFNLGVKVFVLAAQGQACLGLKYSTYDGGILGSTM